MDLREMSGLFNLLAELEAGVKEPGCGWTLFKDKVGERIILQYIETGPNSVVFEWSGETLAELGANIAAHPEGNSGIES